MLFIKMKLLLLIAMFMVCGATTCDWKWKFEYSGCTSATDCESICKNVKWTLSWDSGSAIFDNDPRDSMYYSYYNSVACQEYYTYFYVDGTKTYGTNPSTVAQPWSALSPDEYDYDNY